ncbi:MAG: hypothetical protein NVSMB2_04610 [Chloroflexota bacterium]
MALALLAGAPPARTYAQEEKCAKESVAADSAAAVLEVDDAAYLSTIEQIIALSGALSAYPELAGLQASLIVDATQLLATSQDGAIDRNAARDWAQSTAQGEAAQIQAGLVGPDGAVHPEVQQLFGLEQVAAQQAQAMTAHAQSASDAFVTLVGCLAPGTDTGSGSDTGSGDDAG